MDKGEGWWGSNEDIPSPRRGERGTMNPTLAAKPEGSREVDATQTASRAHTTFVHTVADFLDAAQHVYFFLLEKELGYSIPCVLHPSISGVVLLIFFFSVVAPRKLKRALRLERKACQRIVDVKGWGAVSPMQRRRRRSRGRRVRGQRKWHGSVGIV